MIVCICRNVNEDKIKKELENETTVKGIVKKFDCLQCKICIPDIKRMYQEYHNAGVVERFTQQT